MTGNNTNPQLDTLPKRMRYAAEVCSEAAARLNPNDSLGWMYSTWSSDSFHRVAVRWEAEDAAAAAEESAIEELARAWYSADTAFSAPPWERFLYKDSVRFRARKMYEAGWRRGEQS